MSKYKFFFAVLCLFLFAGCRDTPGKTSGAQAGKDWRSDWAVQEQFSISIDTEGYHFPSAIAFIPNPGPGPKDPLYFVTELRGKIKVVTNDRTIYTFAENFFNLSPAHELPDIEGEIGLAGLCLDPENGYVFATFAYHDAERISHNNIIRFLTQPGTFSIQPISQVDFADVFSGEEVAPSHQIGSCQVSGDALYVSTADGRQTEKSQQIDSSLGKVLRMSLDGQPLRDNPFYEDGSSTRAVNYVWAYGFRNPFGLKVIGDRVFVADNGSGIDRFLDVKKGENYLWDGSDWSIGARADLSISPAIGPVRVEYAPKNSRSIPEELRHTFFIASSAPKAAGIVAVPYSMETKRAMSAPRFILQYRGDGYQSVVGMGIGPDGLYFLPLMPDEQGRSPVLKMTRDPESPHPYLLADNEDPESLMNEKGCYGCHSLDQKGGTAGPALDRKPMVERIQARLNSPDYAQSLKELEQSDREPYRSFNRARAEVNAAEGQQKLRLWMKYHILEPKFDNPGAQMPNLGLTEREALLITDFLLQEEDTFLSRGKSLLQRVPALVLERRELVILFTGGFIAGALSLAVLNFSFQRTRDAWSRRRAFHKGNAAPSKANYEETER